MLLLPPIVAKLWKSQVSLAILKEIWEKEELPYVRKTALRHPLRKKHWKHMKKSNSTLSSDIQSFELNSQLKNTKEDAGR